MKQAAGNNGKRQTGKSARALPSGPLLLGLSIMLHIAILMLLPAPRSAAAQAMQAIRIQLSDPLPEPQLPEVPLPLPEVEAAEEAPVKQEPIPTPIPRQQPEEEPVAQEQQPSQPEQTEPPAELIASEDDKQAALPVGDEPATEPLSRPGQIEPAPQSMPVDAPPVRPQPKPAPAPEPEPGLSADEIKALLTDYARNARSRIINRQSMPEQARRLGHSGSVKLKFVVNSSGQIDSLEIAESSGHDELDEQALSAVRSAAPFGSLPEGIERDTLPMSITLKYRVD